MPENVVSLLQGAQIANRPMSLRPVSDKDVENSDSPPPRGRNGRGNGRSSNRGDRKDSRPNDKNTKGKSFKERGNKKGPSNAKKRSVKP